MMGSSLVISQDESLVFGAPYAWIGSGWRGKYNAERRVGTIAKFNHATQKIAVPTPVDLNTNGAHWGYGTARKTATEADPRRHDLTGVSFVKGICCRTFIQ